ncbi:hypothetical protein OG225_02645 [Nocardia sp. NBC_01377]|uniref:hypothetical protein n=1 Tax=Nocardia sp. NBC_01377 TaxID=2903595 RepID=UPI003249DF11
MYSEHEDHMRADYDTAYRLEGELFEVRDRAEIARIGGEREQIAQRWADGPHAEQWGYLEQAHRDWRWTPNAMRRFVEGDEFNRARAGSELTDVQLRSQEQARRLTGNDRPRQRPQRGR